MKAIHIKCFLAAALTLLFSSCVSEKYEAGAPESENCMGVYFVEGQANAKAHTLEKGVDPTSLEFKVRRSDVSKSVEIPYEYSVYRVVQVPSDTIYVEEPLYDNSKFKFGRLQFNEGQRETTIKVEFNGISTGEVYNCSISINDPEFVPVYGYGSSSVSFSVQMYEWKQLDGKAIYRDAFFSDMFSWKGRYLETEVKIYERKDKKNYFRLEGVYSAAYLARLVEGEEAYEANKAALEETYRPYLNEKAFIYVDASDPEKVYLPDQHSGFSDSSLGDIYIASDVEEVFGAASNLLYGKLSEDKVITFPKNAILFGMGGYYYFSNSSGKMRIVLPGGKAEDYGIDAEVGECDANGKTPATFTVAKDVKTLKYKVFKGVVNEIEMADKLNEVQQSGKTVNVSADEREIKVEVTPEDSEAKTNIYTVLACTFGEGDASYREYVSIQFGYIKPGDERKVEIYMGLSADDRLAGSNFTSENSFQYWVRGKNLTHAQMSYYPTAYYETYEENIKETLKLYGSVGTQTLKQLNSDGLSGVLGNTLKAGTSYTFVVYAGNGYHSEFITETITTGGVQDLMKRSYYLSDLQKYEQPSVESYAGTWVPVSVDIFGNSSEGRTIRGNWRTREVELTVNDNIVTAAGLFPSLSNNPSIKFEYKDGLLNTVENKCPKVWVKDSTNVIPSLRFEYQYIPKTGALSSSGYFYESFDDDDTKERRDMFVAGFVHEDVIAFADNGTDLEFWALVLGGYQKNRMGEEVLQTFIGDAHGELILVRKGSPMLESLKYSNSSTVEEEVTLNSLNEANRIEMPEINSVIKNLDLKEAEIAHGLLEFNSDVRLKTVK